MNHGTVGGYQYHGCRCDACTQAHTDCMWKQRTARYAYVREHGLPGHVAHGVSAYRNWGCRCDVCVEAGARDNAFRRARRKHNRMVAEALR